MWRDLEVAEHPAILIDLLGEVQNNADTEIIRNDMFSTGH